MLDNNINLFIRRAEAAKRLKQKYGSSVLSLPSHGFLFHPKEYMRKLCDFLEVPCEEEYLDACSKLLRNKPSVTRTLVVWTEEQKKRVYDFIDKTPFLKSYTFQST